MKPPSRVRIGRWRQTTSPGYGTQGRKKWRDASKINKISVINKKVFKNPQGKKRRKKIEKEKKRIKEKKIANI